MTEVHTDLLKNKVVPRCATITGLLLLFTSLIHFLNINETLVAIKTGDIALSYAPSATGMWLLGGMSMSMLGIWLLFLAGDLKQRRRKAWWQGVMIGVALSAFGIGAWLAYPRAFHFLYFLLPGLILLIPLVYYGKQYR